VSSCLRELNVFEKTNNSSMSSCDGAKVAIWITLLELVQYTHVANYYQEEFYYSRFMAMKLLQNLLLVINRSFQIHSYEACCKSSLVVNK
jgi:hypothetical protein